MNFIPHRYSERSVRRFVPILRALSEGDTPRRLQFLPTDMGLNVTTAIARLRDAVHSLTTQLVVVPHLNPQNLAVRWKNYRIESDGVNVQLLPRQTEQELPEIGFTSDSQTTLGVLRTDEPQFDSLLAAFAVLLSSRKLFGSVRITGQLSDNTKDELMNRYDVAFVDSGTDTIML